MRDGWFEHDLLGLATKTHPCVSDGTAKRSSGQTRLNDSFSAFSVCQYSIAQLKFLHSCGRKPQGKFLEMNRHVLTFSEVCFTLL